MIFFDEMMILTQSSDHTHSHAGSSDQSSVMLMIHGNSLMILIPPQGSKVIWILFSCFDPRDNCNILHIVLHPLVIHKQNETSISDIVLHVSLSLRVYEFV